MAKYHGSKGVVYLSTSGSGTPAASVGLSSWSLNFSTDKVETTAFGNTNKTYVQGLPDVQGDISGFWDDTYDGLYDASRSTDGLQMYLYPSADAPTKYWYGPAWLDFSITTGNSDAVQVSGSFVANGDWSQQ